MLKILNLVINHKSQLVHTYKSHTQFVYVER